MVQDTGIGIPPEVMPLIFKEFYQADSALTRPYGGSGLGLAISQRLAQAMKGSIGAESGPGGGSIFTLSLQAAHSASAPRQEDIARHRVAMARHSMVTPPQNRIGVPVVAFANDEIALATLANQVRPAVNLVWTTKPDEIAESVRRERASLVILDSSARQG